MIAGSRPPSARTVNLSPSPLTAALAGAFSAIALPLMRHWIGQDEGLNIPLILAMIVTVALPAQTFVVGQRSDDGTGARTWDAAMFKRIGAWIAAAGVVTGLRWLMA